MATIPGFTAITGAALSTADKTYAADVSAADPQDRSITYAELIAFLAANGLIATSLIDQPDGVAGLDASGHIVGPVIIEKWANAAAAGTQPDGTLAKVGDALVLHDGVTVGGNALANTCDSHLFPVGFDGSETIALDPTAASAFIYVRNDNPGQVTVSNYAALPIGYAIEFCTLDVGDEFTMTLSLNGVVATHNSTGKMTSVIRKIANTGTADTDYLITIRYELPV